jgi:hypothetical protein
MIHNTGSAFYLHGNGDPAVGTEVRLDAELKTNAEFAFRFTVGNTMLDSLCMDWFPTVLYPCSHYAVIKSGECDAEEVSDAKLLLLAYFRKDLQKFQQSLEDFAKANEETTEEK